MSPGEKLRAVSEVNEVVLALQIAPMLVEERRRRGRGRPPKYRRWELFALRIVRELLPRAHTEKYLLTGGFKLYRGLSPANAQHTPGRHVPGYSERPAKVS